MAGAAGFEPATKGFSMSEVPSSITPIALKAKEGEALWFLGILVTVKAASETTAGRVAVLEHHAPRGSGSPMHVHRREDEWFYVTEGELTFWVGGEVIEAPAGAFVYGPRDIPHTFEVTCDELASCSLPSPPASRNLCAQSPSPRRASPSPRRRAGRPIPRP